MGEKITKDAVRDFFASNIALALVITYTIVLLSSIMANVQNGESFFSAMCVTIMPILFCVGLWILYYSAKNSDKINTTGFSLIKIYVIVTFVLQILVGALLLICGIIFTVVGFAVKDAYIDTKMIEESLENILAVSGISDSGQLSGIVNIDSKMIIDIIGIAGIILLFIAVIFLTLLIIYNVFLIKAVDSIRKVVETGIPNSKFPVFIIVLLYIATVGYGVSIFTSLLYLYTGEVWMVINAIAEFVLYILFIVSVNKYKEIMKETEIKVALMKKNDATVEDSNEL